MLGAAGRDMASGCFYTQQLFGAVRWSQGLPRCVTWGVCGAWGQAVSHWGPSPHQTTGPASKGRAVGSGCWTGVAH